VATGTCVDNASGYKVSSSVCAGIDLAVGANCSDTAIPVCNHGNTTITANKAELVFYPKKGQQFASESPVAGWEAGRCTITADIAPGACIDQTCPTSLLDEDLTVRVAAKTASGVTECSALDNWSYFIKGRTCVGTSSGGSLTRTEKYEAKCPADTSPVWGFFTWNASTPGASKIDFDMRTATTDAGLTTAGYTAVQGAASSPVDTQVCSLSGGPSVCPVNISKSLWGTAGKKSQPRFLELRANLNSSGTNTPTLKDWKITYSCVYDQ
ncbi:MAG TPA: hypothetical protein VLC09_18900, partial [Polyangiaceae bacterium]|nr:hypothetical protein [Polyangiaceae bacterium]